MIGFSTKVYASEGDDISSLIAQIMADNSLATAQKAAKGAEAFDKIVRRSLGKTGSFLFKKLKGGFKDGSLGLSPLRTHPANGATMSEMLKRFRPQDLAGGVKVKPVKTSRQPGGKFAALMQYEIDDHDGKNLTVGLIPKRRGGDKWAKRFSDWQEAGDIDQNEFFKFNLIGMYRYFKALGMPITKFPSRPARNVIEKIDEREDPTSLFEKFFLERLLA